MQEDFIAEQEALSEQLLRQHQHILQELEALKHPGSALGKEHEPDADREHLRVLELLPAEAKTAEEDLQR